MRNEERVRTRSNRKDGVSSLAGNLGWNDDDGRLCEMR